MRPSALTNEEEELERLLWESGHVCADCGEPLHVLDELILVQVGYPFLHQSLTFCAVEDDHGQYKYAPFFFHFSCFEDVCDNTSPDDPLEDAQWIIKCTNCNAGIRAW